MFASRVVAIHYLLSNVLKYRENINGTVTMHRGKNCLVKIDKNYLI